MPDKNKGRLGSNLRLTPHWLLITLVLGVLTLFSLAYASPISQNNAGVLPQETDDVPTPPGFEQTPTPDPQELPPPTPEEIGYTDGIIFWSTLLVLILLIGTLRETLYRKGR